MHSCYYRQKPWKIINFLFVFETIRAILLYIAFPFVSDIRIELRGVAIVFWGAQEEKEDAEKTEAQIDETKGDCNKEQYFQKVILLEKGLSVFNQSI
jgi:hypothetical protein